MLTSWLPVAGFFLRPNNLPSAERKVDFFLCGESLLWVVCLLGASLTTEYLTVLSTGFVALLSGGGILAGETARGELFRGDVDWWGGDRDAGRDSGRDAGCSTGVLIPVGGAGGGVDGGSGRTSRARSVRLAPEPALTDAGGSVGAGA